MDGGGKEEPRSLPFTRETLSAWQTESFVPLGEVILSFIQHIQRYRVFQPFEDSTAHELQPALAGPTAQSRNLVLK